MRFVQSDPSALYGRAFCLSSVRLFCGTNVDSSCEIAGHVEQNGRILGSSLCIAEARGDTTRVWIPYIEVASADSAVLMRLVEGMRQHFASTPIFAVALAEPVSVAAKLLLQAGWALERYFPVQICWPNLARLPAIRDMHFGEVTVDENPDRSEVANLFASAFLDEWEWYFGEMGYDAQVSSRQALYDLAEHYVE